jgi:hypothetical protein
MTESGRKPVTIRFRFNKESGEIEDLIVDDNAPNASEPYHDRVAELIARQLGAKARIQDAGPIRFDSTTHRTTGAGEEREEREERSDGEVIEE